MVDKVLNIITIIRKSDTYIEHIYMRGGCYQFFLILKQIFPTAVPYIHQDKDHVVTLLFGHLFDIRGMIDTEMGNLYSPLVTPEDIEMVNEWRFSRNQVLQLCECPECGEPIIYDKILDTNYY